MTAFQHIPVLASAVVELVMPDPARPCRILDGTVGGGGHSALILEKNPHAEILGLDRDAVALRAAAERLAFAQNRVQFVQTTFSRLAEAAHSIGWDYVDGILLDIGVSSPQIDDPARGFSFRQDGPLDMRMDRSAPLTAADLLNRADERELTHIFRDYGEIREASRLARRVIAVRAVKPILTCAEFASCCDAVLGTAAKKRGGLPAPTLPFQALRIAVNDELGELDRALEAGVKLLNPGGRFCVISFHSLEDRIVKRFFADMAVSCKCPPGCPVCICGWKPKLSVLTKKPQTAEPVELAVNPRSACAKLRAAERTEVPADESMNESIYQ